MMKILKHNIETVCLCLILLLAFSLTAQIEFDPENDVGLKISVNPSTVPSESASSISIEIDLPENVHITGGDDGFFFVEMDSLAGVIWQETVFSSGVMHEEDLVYRGLVKVTKPFSLKGVHQPGDRIEVYGILGYQICTENDPIYCTPPVERNFKTTFTIGEASGQINSDPKSNPEKTGEANAKLSIEERTRKALESGSWVVLLWIFLGGVALSFTPCVYPVIPITIAYIGARSGGSRLKGFTLSLVFVLGLGLVYSTLGVVAAATGGVFGLSTQNPWVIGFVSVVFLIMGAGMMGAFEISLPSSVQTKLSSKKRSGYIGALFVGGTTGLIAAPCVGPVLVALLGWVSSAGNLFLGFLYLFVFAMGLGMLFIVIGTFAGVLAALPKAGGWMEKVKVVFGVILIAAALYLGKSLIPPTLFTILVGLALMILAGLMGGFSRLDSDAELSERFWRALAAFTLLLGIFYTLTGLFKAENINLSTVGSAGNPSSAIEPLKASSGANWIENDIDEAFARAKQSNKPVVIDFWAEWCAACLELEHKTFSAPIVYEKLNSDFIALKVDGTTVNEEIKQTWNRFRIHGLPTVLFMTPDRKEITRFEAFRTVDEVLPILLQVASE